MFKLPQHSSLPVPSHVRQIDGLQLLRAVAVILVVWFHSGELIPSAWPLDLGTFGIDIFFVISGFILSLVVLRERRPPGLATSWAFLSRRLLRIFPIYWVFCAAFAARQLLAHHPIDRDQWFSLTLLPSPWSIYPLFLVAFAWTLVFEMFFYYVFALTLLATVRHATYLLIFILSALVLLGYFIDIHHPVLIIVFNPIQLEFVFGAVIAQAFAHWGPRRRLGDPTRLTKPAVIVDFGLRSSVWPVLMGGSAVTLAQVSISSKDVERCRDAASGEHRPG